MKRFIFSAESEPKAIVLRVYSGSVAGCSMNRFIHFRRGECLWIAPFLGLALIALGLLRPLPRFPLPAHSRTVVDSGGIPVPIALPFRGIALAPNTFPNGYLENTRSPGLLVYAGKPSDRKRFASDVMSWVYPEVLKERCPLECAAVPADRFSIRRN